MLGRRQCVALSAAVGPPCRPTGHRFVTPVARGTQVASFFRLQSMVRDVHARSMIFDLDTAIQTLVERLGRHDPETVKFTGIYRNLIRTGPKYEPLTCARDCCCDGAGDAVAGAAGAGAAEAGAGDATHARGSATPGRTGPGNAAGARAGSCSIRNVRCRRCAG